MLEVQKSSAESGNVLHLIFQLVVEMRTQELHRLRDERARHMQQLEELEDTRNRLAKMQAKVEDLQAQLETKAKVERYSY